MIIKEIPNERKDGKSSFKDLIDYATNGKKDGKEKVEYVNYQNVIGIDTAALEMEALASENKRCSDPVYHFVLSFRELEIPTNEQVDEAVKIALEELNLDKCQAVWGLHYNTENRHVHVAVNRIDPETTKAIQPANNWTYKANERAARKIEIAQGWKIEQSGHHYVVTPDGQIVPKGKEKETTPALSTGARDSEAHTAAKSAERIGQEVAAPIIRAAKTWGELHENLAAQGITIEKKGSGAILKIGDITIKVSVVGRDISISKLEGRLGNYEPRGADVAISPRLPEPTEKVTSKLKGTWEEYQALREEYRQIKIKSLDVLKEKQKKEKEAMSERQKAERTKIFEGKNWNGRGRTLNQIRSITAARQKAEKLNLRDLQRNERKNLQNFFPRTFPNFKTWIEEKDNPLSVLFRYQNQPVILQETQSERKKNIFSDLRAFTAVVGNKGGVAYTRKRNNHESDFLDYGKKILLSDKYDSESILAALQLASQKWGSVSLNGTDDYKKLCVIMAVKYNVKITNPELQEMIEDEKKKIGRTKLADLFNEYADAVGADKFRIVVTEFKPEGGVQAFVMDKANEGKTKDEICKSMHRLETYVKYNKNINIVPLSADKHHILIDDVSPENLEKIREEGYNPACVIESSPSNYQVILNVKSLGSDEDRDAANRITKELNIRYGDPKLSGAVHAHRLPPFPNLKEKHRRDDGTFPETKLVESNGGLCDKAFDELKVISEQFKEKAHENILKDKTRLTSWNTGANDHTGAYWSHYRDIADKQKGSMDYSRVDAMIGVRMRVTGYSPSQVQAAIEDNAPAMRKENMTENEYNEKYRNRDWHRFAKETTEKFVFGPRGTIQYSKAEDYRPYYMKLEGRNTADEMREFQKMKHERDITQEREGEEI